MITLEKLENCPHCEKDLEQGEYDAQVCRSCVTGVDFKKDEGDAQ